MKLSVIQENLARGLAVFLGNLARGRAVQVEAAGCGHQRLEVRRAGGVPVQHDGQGLAREQAGGALLDVGLDAQLDGLGRALRAEQGREQFRQPGGALRRGQLGLGGVSCGNLFGAGSRRRGHRLDGVFGHR